MPPLGLPAHACQRLPRLFIWKACRAYITSATLEPASWHVPLHHHEAYHHHIELMLFAGCMPLASLYL